MQRRRLLADEQGTLTKVAPLRVALCYPSPYHVGMSSLGFQSIYREIHAHDGASAERAFLPDDVEAFRRVVTLGHDLAQAIVRGVRRGVGEVDVVDS